MYWELLYALPVVTVLLFYRLGRLAAGDVIGTNKPIIWAAVSVVGWVVSLFVLDWPIFFGFALQFPLLIAVFVGSAVWRMVTGKCGE